MPSFYPLSYQGEISHRLSYGVASGCVPRLQEAPGTPEHPLLLILTML